jgi:hypothetical protein
MLLYTAYIAISVLYFSYIKPRVDETIQCFFWDATMDLALSNPACGIYLLAWCLSSGFVFWVYFTCHHENLLRYKAYQLLFVKTVAQIIMCITGVSPQIPITMSCCAYVLCAVEYLNWRCCDPLYVVEYNNRECFFDHLNWCRTRRDKVRGRRRCPIVQK